MSLQTGGQTWPEFTSGLPIPSLGSHYLHEGVDWIRGVSAILTIDLCPCCSRMHSELEFLCSVAFSTIHTNHLLFPWQKWVCFNYIINGLLGVFSPALGYNFVYYFNRLLEHKVSFNDHLILPMYQIYFHKLYKYNINVNTLKPSLSPVLLFQWGNWAHEELQLLS